MRYGHLAMSIFCAWVLVLELTGTGFADADMALDKFKELGGNYYQGAVVGATWALRFSDIIQCGSVVTAGMVRATLDAHKEWNNDNFSLAIIKAHTNLGCSLHLVSDVPDTVDPRTPKAVK